MEEYWEQYEVGANPCKDFGVQYSPGADEHGQDKGASSAHDKFHNSRKHWNKGVAMAAPAIPQGTQKSWDIFMLNPWVIP